ncbi:MAG: flagellar hook-basal body protein [Vulcanimicrobiota bacterium]
MMEGMKRATQGMMAMQEQQSVIANNLANVGTTGFRRDVMDVQSFNQILDNQMKQVSMPGQTGNGFLQVSGGMDTKGMLYTNTRTSYAQGALKMTGNNFDVALDDNGKGFFTVQGKDGIKFTRNGSFRLSNEGYLVTGDGSKVMGHNGAIKLNGTNFQVNDAGVISVDGKEVDKFLVTEFTDKANMQKNGEDKFTANKGFKISDNFAVKQGYLEMGNVNIVREMTEMMKVMKSYEANQKVLQAQDQAWKKSVNEVGKTG